MIEKFKSHSAPAPKGNRLKARPKPGDKPISKADMERALAEAQEGGEKNASGAPKEIGGRGGLEPTRYGDWEVGGKCIDF
jgi:hypothetical protein